MKLGTDLSNQQPIDISTDTIRRGTHVIGVPGVGKTVLLEHITFDRLREGWGVCVMDPNGDYVDKIADTVPEERFNDVIYFDPSNLSTIIGYNPLKDVPEDKRHLVAGDVLSAIMHATRAKGRHENFYDKMEALILRNSLRLLLDNNCTLAEIGQLLSDRAYRTKLLRNVSDPTVLSFWTNQFAGWDSKQEAEYTVSLHAKMDQLLSNPALRNVLANDGLDLSDIMNKRKVLLCNLSKGKLGEEASNLLGALLTSGFSQAAQARASIPEDERRDFILIIDEFQNFTTTEFAAILSEARKYRLSLVVAHQFMSQIPDFLQDAVIGTVNTTICFRCGVNDAALLAPAFGLHTPILVNDHAGTHFCEDGLHTANVLTMTDAYHAWVKTVEGGKVRKPTIMLTDPPQTAGGRLEAVRAHTRTCYGKPRA